MHLLITTPTGFEKQAIEEIERISEGKIKVKTTFFKGVLLGSTTLKREEIKEIFSKETSFIRKILPVDKITKAEEKEFIEFFSNYDVKNKRFAVRCKRRGEHSFTSKDIEIKVGKALKEKGGIVDLENPEILFIIEIIQNKACLTIISPREIIVKKPKFEKRWIHEKRPISRAEQKIREIIKRYPFVFSKEKTVLDIGAAPGGWSREMSKRVKKVIAVDPAELDEEVRAIKNVVHIKKKAQELELSEKVDVITNDANILDFESAELSISLANKFLKDKGYLIHTIKMERFSKRIIEEIEEKFAEAKIEKIETIKLKYNTKNEITFIGRKK